MNADMGDDLVVVGITPVAELSQADVEFIERVRTEEPGWKTNDLTVYDVVQRGSTAERSPQQIVAPTNPAIQVGSAVRTAGAWASVGQSVEVTDGVMTKQRQLEFVDKIEIAPLSADEDKPVAHD